MHKTGGRNGSGPRRHFPEREARLMPDSGTFTYDNKSIELPVRKGSIGPSVVDIQKLYAKTGHVHLRSGLHLDRRLRQRRSPTSTATRASCCIAAIRSSSWPSKSNFLESATCCSTGELPNKAQLADFDKRVTRHTMVHEQMHFFYRASAATRTRWRCVRRGRRHGRLLSRLDRHQRSAQREIASIRMIAKIPTIAAMAYKYSVGQPFVYPRNDLDYASNFLHMCFSVPASPMW
jgi:citrate synthase